MIGRGTTCPIVIAHYLVQKEFEGNLVLITDGLIKEKDVKILVNYLGKHPIAISTIECHLITTTEKLNATVIAPFISRYNHIVYYYDQNNYLPKIIAKGGLS